MNTVLIELVVRIQHLIDQGWHFEQNDDTLIATKQNQSRQNNQDVMDFLQELVYEEDQAWQEKLLYWFKTSPRGANNSPCCPQCGQETQINRFDCDCGWKL